MEGTPSGRWQMLDSVYVQSYAMIEHLVRKRGERRLRGFMRQIVRGGNVERLLKREMRVTLDELDRNLRAEYR